LPNQALTVDLNSGDLHLIDEFGVLSTVFAGDSAVDVVISPDGTTALVSLFAPQELRRFEVRSSGAPTLTGVVAMPFNAEDVDIACTSSGLALVTDGGSIKAVASVDITTMTVVDTLMLPHDAVGVEVTPDGSLAVITAYGSARVQFVQVSPTGTLTDLGSAPSGANPINIGISPNGNIAIVTNSETVSVYDLNTLSLAQTLNLGFGFHLNQSVVFAPDGSKAYVYNVEEPVNIAGRIIVLDIDASDTVTDPGINFVVGSAASFFGVDQLAITPDGLFLYVRSTSGYEVIDLLTNNVAPFIPLPGATGNGGIATGCTVQGACPSADPGGPYLVAVNEAVLFDGTASTDPDGDLLTYGWSTDTGSLNGEMPTYAADSAAGIFTVSLTVDDGTCLSEPADTIVVVYDPDGGFVTGGGWIWSEPGDYVDSPDLEGKANFGFVSKYTGNGAQVPTGNTEFQFKAGDLNFHSNTYQWLVINQGGSNAQFKGTGTINGDASPAGANYKFMIWATDDSDDTFRIKIWYEDGGQVLVYDCGDTLLGGGNIKVHK